MLQSPCRAPACVGHATISTPTGPGKKTFRSQPTHPRHAARVSLSTVIAHTIASARSATAPRPDNRRRRSSRQARPPAPETRPAKLPCRSRIERDRLGPRALAARAWTSLTFSRSAALSTLSTIVPLVRLGHHLRRAPRLRGPRHPARPSLGRQASRRRVLEHEQPASPPTRNHDSACIASLPPPADRRRPRCGHISAAQPERGSKLLSKAPFEGLPRPRSITSRGPQRPSASSNNCRPAPARRAACRRKSPSSPR